MNIIYIGDFKETYSTERYIAYAFRQLGYTVTCIPEQSLDIQNPSAVLSDIKQLNPVLVLFSKGRPRGQAELLIEMMKVEGIKTCCWLFDLFFGLPVNRRSKLERLEAPYNCELVVSTDGGHQKEFESLGIRHKVLRQGIHEPEAILYDREKVHDVIFVGGDAFHTREKLIKNLKERYAFTQFGNKPDNQVRGLPLNELYAATKVVVGDSQPSPRYWSNRIYETLGRGGFLIHPRVAGLEEEFEDGKHLVMYEYGNLDDLNAKIDYYLTHDKEREKIRKAGFAHVKRNFTYQKRCEQLLKML